MNVVLTNMLYLPPVSYFAYLQWADRVVIEQHDSFQKASYRNRCHIIGPNGTERLSIPVQQGREVKSAYRNVKIAYTEPWAKEHWFAFRTNYNRSPFFEHYEPFFEPFYLQQYHSLYVFNSDLLELLLKLLGISVDIAYTTEFERQPINVLDIRDKLKQPDALANYRLVKYHQVFEDKHGFVPNLSIVDLLFNEGPNASAILSQSIIT